MPTVNTSNFILSSNRLSGIFCCSSIWILGADDGEDEDVCGDDQDEDDDRHTMMIQLSYFGNIILIWIFMCERIDVFT